MTEPAKPAPVARLPALDHLRAVAMLLGIALHAAIAFVTFPLPWVAQDVSAHWTFDVLTLLIHGFRMQLFFFLAGFFARLLHERLGTQGFLRQRAVRIGVPFVLGMLTLIPLLGAIFFWAQHTSTNSPPLPLDTLRSWHDIPTAHLWFLQYLLCLYALVALLVPLGRRLPQKVFDVLDVGFDRLFRSPLRALPFVPPVMLCVWDGPMFGEVENAGFGLVPKASAVACYGIYFTVGWWLHRRRECLTELTRQLPVTFALAALAWLVHATILGTQPTPAQPDFLKLKLTSLACAALYAWLMTFALTGWFLRSFSEPRPCLRYLADASYWCYLAHLPLVMALQVLAARWPVNGWLKFLLMNALTLALLLIGYHFGVRYTWLGRLLNGPRERQNIFPAAAAIGPG